MKIGHVIRHLRNARKATLADIAFAVDTDAANLSRIERGEQNPSPELTAKLAQEFKLPVSAFYLMAEQTLASDPGFGSSDEARHAAQRLEVLVAKFMLLSDSHQRMVNDFIDVMLKAQP